MQPTALLSRPDYREAAYRLSALSKRRLHWVLMTAAGLKDDEVCHIARGLDPIDKIAQAIGLSCTESPQEASLCIFSRLKESHLLMLANQIKPGSRIIAVNEEHEIGSMTDRSFELATAAIFDRESRTVLRIFDAEAPTAGYIHIELADMNDQEAATAAARIADAR